MSVPEQGDRNSSSRAVRLTFMYEGSDIHLLSQQYIEMVVPPSDILAGFESEQGFWIEVRTARDDLLYRQVIPDPFRPEIEVFSSDPDQSIARVRLDRPSGTFAVLIPETPEADHINLVSAAPGIKRSAAELARFNIRPNARGGES
jgi:hypothetical protein